MGSGGLEVEPCYSLGDGEFEHTDRTYTLNKDFSGRKGFHFWPQHRWKFKDSNTPAPEDAMNQEFVAWGGCRPLLDTHPNSKPLADSRPLPRLSIEGAVFM